MKRPTVKRNPALIAIFKKTPKQAAEPIPAASFVEPISEPILVESPPPFQEDSRLSDLMEKVRQLEVAKQQLEGKDYTVLATLTEQELGVYFADLIPASKLEQMDDVLEMGIEMLTRRHKELTFDIAQLRKKKPLAMPTPPTADRLPKVTVIGLLSVQAQTVEDRLRGRAKFNFVPKSRTDNKGGDGSCVPHNQDIIVLAAKFISHSIQDHTQKRVAGTNTKVIVHHGGVDMMIRRLDEHLPQLFAS